MVHTDEMRCFTQEVSAYNSGDEIRCEGAAVWRDMEAPPRPSVQGFRSEIMLQSPLRFWWSLTRCCLNISQSPHCFLELTSNLNISLVNRFVFSGHEILERNGILLSGYFIS